MTSPFLPDFRFSPSITTLILALQLSACGSEDLLSAISPEIGSDTDIITNDAAKISGVKSGSVVEDVDPDGDNLLEVSGKLDIVDSDSGEEAFIAKIVNGDYGDLDIDAAGNWDYAARNDQPAIQNLEGNATLTDNLTVSSIDGTTLTIEITIIGVVDSDNNTNSPAVISGTNTGSVTEDIDPDGDSLLETSGKLDITDSDTGEDVFIATTFNGDYGILTIDATGNWRYAADNNQSSIQNLTTASNLSDSLTVSSIDGTTRTVTITIFGTDEVNSPAIITGTDSGSVTEDVDPDNDNLLETSGKLDITDSDTGEDAFIATTFNGDYGLLTIDTTGNWRYAADNNQSSIQNLTAASNLSDSLTVSSIDGTTRTVTITIFGTDEVNSPAIITGTDSGSVTEDVDPDNDNLLETSGKLNISDSDPGQAGFLATTNTGSYGSLTINTAGNWNYAANNNLNAIQSLNAGDALFDSLIVSSIDGTTRAIVITIAGSNEVNTPSNIDISWVAPAEREDNTPISLTEIAGYKIYYGSAKGQYPSSVSVNDSNAIGYSFQNFSSGTYYFVVTTVDTDGRESQFSTEIIYTI